MLNERKGMVRQKNKNETPRMRLESLEARVEQIESQLKAIERRLDPIAKTDRLLKSQGR